jgi:hypothetical protein
VQRKNLKKQNNVEVTNNIIDRNLHGVIAFQNVHDGGDITRAFKIIWQDIQISAKV